MSSTVDLFRERVPVIDEIVKYKSTIYIILIGITILGTVLVLLFPPVSAQDAPLTGNESDIAPSDQTKIKAANAALVGVTQGAVVCRGCSTKQGVLLGYAMIAPSIVIVIIIIILIFSAVAKHRQTPLFRS